jgi:hypothetical protein
MFTTVSGLQKKLNKHLWKEGKEEKKKRIMETREGRKKNAMEGLFLNST